MTFNKLAVCVLSDLSSTPARFLNITYIYIYICPIYPILSLRKLGYDYCHTIMINCMI